MYRLVSALAIVCLVLGGCSDEGETADGRAGSSAGGTSGASGGGGSGGLGGAAASAGASCVDAPIAKTHDGPTPDLTIAPLAGVKHDVAIEYLSAGDGYAVAHVTRTPEKQGLALEIRWVTVSSGALDAGTPELVTDPEAPSGSNAGWPSIAADASGSKLLVVWGDDRAGDGVGPIDIFGQFFEVSANGLVKSGSNFVISTQSATNDWRPRAVYAASAQRYWVAWADDRAFDAQSGARHVWARSVGPDGTLGAETELGDGASWQDGVRMASDGSRVLFVWGHADETTNPIVSRHLARFVDATSGEKAPLETIFERDSVVLAPPAVARDTARCRYLIVWQESDNQQIWGLVKADDGSTLRERFQITTTEAGSGSPHLAFSPASNTFLLGYGTWLDAEGWVLELDALGDPLGPARSMHGAPPQNGTYFQDIAAGLGHALAISNEDYNRIEGALFTLCRQR